MPSIPPRYFFKPPGRYWDRFGSVAAVASSTNNELVRVDVPTGHTGVLLAMGLDSGQLSGWYWASFKLEIDGQLDGEFGDVRGMIARLLDPIEVYRTFQSSVRILVDNLNTAQNFQMQGRIQAFTQDTKVLYGEGSLAPGFSLPRGT